MFIGLLQICNYKMMLLFLNFTDEENGKSHFLCNIQIRKKVLIVGSVLELYDIFRESYLNFPALLLC